MLFIDCVGVQLLDRPLEARSIVLTRRGRTLVYVGFAVLSSVAFPTLARIVLDLVDTSGVVFALIGLAVVDVELAVLAFEAGVGTVAAVRVDTVQALSVVETGLGLAIVDVYFAAYSRESGQTVASVPTGK